MVEEFATKKEAILDLLEQNPKMSNSDIAKHTDASISYVTRLIGPNRIPSYKSPKDQRRHFEVMSHARDIQALSWGRFKETQQDFVKNYLPQVRYKNEHDFVKYYLPNEDKFQTAGSGEDLSGSWSQYEYLAERRIGLGPNITMFPAKDAVKEGFQMLNHKTREVIKRDDIYDFMEDTDFLNELARVIYFERVYGIGFLISYYSKNDKDRGILNDPVKKSEGRPVAFEALPPTVTSPIDSYRSDKLDKNPQKWSLQGGLYDPQQIHFSRVRVFMSRPVVTRWFGLSLFERIWDSIIPYYQALIYLLRGFSKWGAMIPKIVLPEDGDLDELFDKNIEVVEEMKANGAFIFPAGTTIDFMPTQLATGLREMMDIWIEDISSGTGIPVPKLMGRVVASGISGAGNLVAERNYWSMIKKIQLDFTDDVRAILIFAGFDLEKQDMNWKLAITKTDQQRLIDEGLEIENELMKEQLIQAKVLSDRMISGEAFEQEEGGDKDKPPSKPGNGSAKKDFMTKVDMIRRKRLEYVKRIDLSIERARNQ